MNWDLAQVIGLILFWTLIGALLGGFLTYQLVVHPEMVDLWVRAHLHFLYVLYHPEFVCPDGYSCIKL